MLFVLSYFFTITLATLYEGDFCELATQKPGKCVHLSQCPSAIQLVRNLQHPDICSFVKIIPIVCCPLNVEPVSPRISEQKCQHYKKLIATLPETKTPKTTIMTTTDNLQESINKDVLFPSKDLFVIGGVQSVAKEFPHMAALGYDNNNEKLWLCGGSLISEKFVMTAAHCLFSKEFGALKWARLGDLDLISPVEDAFPEDYRIIERIPHPSHKNPSVYNDIALVKLHANVHFSNYIQPACLPTMSNLDQNVELIATGWGLTAFQGSKSDILMKVDLELFTEDECEDTYKDMINSRKIKNGILHDLMFCAGGHTDVKDTCQGDSGGPLQIRNGNTYTVVGITSFGKSCGITNLPGVYTKVATYVPWIESIVWPEE